MDPLCRVILYTSIHLHVKRIRRLAPLRQDTSYGRNGTAIVSNDMILATERVLSLVGGRSEIPVL